MTVQEIIESIPIEFEITMGKHCNTAGYYVQIQSSHRADLEYYWEDASHGITLDEAIYNAHCRFTDQEETLYIEDDFENQKDKG